MNLMTKRLGAGLRWLQRGRLVVMVCVFTLAALIVFPMVGSANNDPHRVFSPPSSGTLSGFCSFPVYYSQPVDKEYSTVTAEPDGSTVVKIEGSLTVAYTNLNTGRSITVNNSGPGTLVFPPSGTVLSYEAEGLVGLTAHNLTAFGFPSDIVVTSGRVDFTFDYATWMIGTVTPMRHVVLDVCAALS